MNQIMKSPANESFQAISAALQKGIPLPELDNDTKNAVLAGISGVAINATRWKCKSWQCYR